VPESTRRRVVVAFHDGEHNGASHATLRAVPGLEERGWEFAFWSPPGALRDKLAADGYVVDGRPTPVFGYSLQNWRTPPGVRARVRALGPYAAHLRRFLGDQRPAIFHANSLYTFLEALVARSLRIPTLLHIHEMAPRRPKGVIVRELARAMAIEIVAVSRASAEPYGRGGRLPAIVHESSPVPARPVEIREAPDPFVVGSIGVISRRKGSDVFVEAARRAGAMRDGLEFHLAGSPTDPLDAEWGEGVLQEARRAGVRHWARVDTWEALRGWDAFVLPARSDPFPLVVLEAMAIGVPVIGAEADGIAEQLADGAGVLTTKDDPGALARAIVELADDPERRRTLGRTARERVRNRYTPEIQAAALDSLYQRLV
jgi:glycosyltransferase involved in cell wall biosynthesis